MEKNLPQFFSPSFCGRLVLRELGTRAIISGVGRSIGTRDRQTHVCVCVVREAPPTSDVLSDDVIGVFAPALLNRYAPPPSSSSLLFTSRRRPPAATAVATLLLPLLLFFSNIFSRRRRFFGRVIIISISSSMSRAARKNTHFPTVDARQNKRVVLTNNRRPRPNGGRGAKASGPPAG